MRFLGLLLLAGCAASAPPKPLDVPVPPPPDDSALKASETGREQAEARATALASEVARLTAQVKEYQDRETAAVELAKGEITLADATVGLPTTGQLAATIKTSMGDLKCQLFEEKAPVSVANFVALARGTRTWQDPLTKQWVKRPAYDNTTFHRIIQGFMIQGGDPKGDGTGEPGFTFRDELWAGAKHDHAGQLCMANRGPNTNGVQFFITDASAPHLDAGYTIFGDCKPLSVVHNIAAVPVGARDKPTTPVTIKTIEITRGGVGGSAPKKP